LMSSVRASTAAGMAKFKLEDYLDAAGNIVMPEGITLTSYLEDNVAELGDTPAYRYLDFQDDHRGRVVELTWREFGVRLHAIGARLQQRSEEHMSELQSRE